MSAFLEFFPLRLNTAIKFENSVTWRPLSQFHYLTDQEISDVIDDRSSRLRAFSFDSKSRFAVLVLPSDSSYAVQDNYGKLADFFAGLGIHLCPYKAAGSDDIHVYIFFDQAVESTLLQNTLTNLLTQAGFQIGAGLMTVAPGSAPLEFPLQKGFAWLKQDLQVSLRREDITLEQSLKLFLSNATSAACLFDQLDNAVQSAAQSTKDMQEIPQCSATPSEVVDNSADLAELFSASAAQPESQALELPVQTFELTLSSVATLVCSIDQSESTAEESVQVTQHSQERSPATELIDQAESFVEKSADLTEMFSPPLVQPETQVLDLPVATFDLVHSNAAAPVCSIDQSEFIGEASIQVTQHSQECSPAIDQAESFVEEAANLILELPVATFDLVLSNAATSVCSIDQSGCIAEKSIQVAPHIQECSHEQSATELIDQQTCRKSHQAVDQTEEYAAPLANLDIQSSELVDDCPETLPGLQFEPLLIQFEQYIQAQPLRPNARGRPKQTWDRSEQLQLFPISQQRPVHDAAVVDLTQERAPPSAI